MTIDVILSHNQHRYVAQVKEWPDVVVEENTRQEALDEVKKRLVNYLTQQVEVVQIDVDLPVQPLTKDNPWIKHFGRFKDDPTFDDLQTEIAAYRQECRTSNTH